MAIEYVDFVDRNTFEAFERKQRAHVGIPLISIRQSDGTPQPNKQQTLRYTLPIEHPTTTEIICRITDQADKTGITPIDKAEAGRRGFNVNAPTSPRLPPEKPRPSMITVPDVVGLTEDEAKKTIIGAGLQTGRTVREVNPRIPLGNVIASKPPGGTTVKVLARVILTVSSDSVDP